MKIFYATQVSNITIKNGKTEWALTQDACINIMKGIVSCILDKKPDWKFLIKIPMVNNIQDSFSKNNFDPQYRKNICFYNEPIPYGPILSRFNFNMDWHLRREEFFKDVDVMINDENTLTKNWNVFFNHINKKIPIVSTNYFLDSPLSPKVKDNIRYWERQMETLINSDMISFPCEASKRQSLEAFNLLFNKNKHTKIKKMSVWNVAVYAKEMKKANFYGRNKIVYFGNRITETANSYTNWQAFSKSIGLLNKDEIVGFKFIMLNPTRKVNEDQLSKIKKWGKGRIEVIDNSLSQTRKEYIDFISKASISCNLFTNEVHGGITSYEAMMAGNLIVCPDINDYHDRFKEYFLNGKKYPYLFKLNKNKTININVLASTISKAMKEIDSVPRILLQELAYKKGSYEEASNIIIKDLEDLVKNK